MCPIQLKDVMRLINTELGAVPQPDPRVAGYKVRCCHHELYNSLITSCKRGKNQVFVRIDSKAQVVGCVVAELLDQVRVWSKNVLRHQFPP